MSKRQKQNGWWNLFNRMGYKLEIEFPNIKTPYFLDRSYFFINEKAKAVLKTVSLEFAQRYKCQKSKGLGELAYYQKMIACMNDRFYETWDILDKWNKIRIKGSKEQIVNYFLALIKLTQNDKT